MATMRQEGIHPRMFSQDSVKKNTAKPRSQKRLERQLAGIEGHLANHPRDSVSTARVSRIKEILKDWK